MYDNDIFDKQLECSFCGAIVNSDDGICSYCGSSMQDELLVEKRRKEKIEGHMETLREEHKKQKIKIIIPALVFSIIFVCGIFVVKMINSGENDVMEKQFARYIEKMETAEIDCINAESVKTKEYVLTETKMSIMAGPIWANDEFLRIPLYCSSDDVGKKVEGYITLDRKNFTNEISGSFHTVNANYGLLNPEIELLCGEEYQKIVNIVGIEDMKWVRCQDVSVGKQVFEWYQKDNNNVFVCELQENCYLKYRIDCDNTKDLENIFKIRDVELTVSAS